MDKKYLSSYAFMKFISTIMMNLTKYIFLGAKIYFVDFVDPLAMKVFMEFLDKNI
jgi:hypothetical protein